MSAKTSIKPFFDPATWTVSDVISDNATKMAAVIDPVLNFDFKSGSTRTESAEEVLGRLRGEGQTVPWILETHAHADHLSSARCIQQQGGGRIAIGENIRQVQAVFKRLTKFPAGRRLKAMLIKPTN